MASAFIFLYTGQVPLDSKVCKQQSLCSFVSIWLDVCSAAPQLSSGQFKSVMSDWDLLSSSALLQWKKSEHILSYIQSSDYAVVFTDVEI